MKTWEDFLSSFDQAQPNVKMGWGPEKKQPPKDKRKQQAINLDKFAGGTGPKPTAAKKLDPKDQAKIAKLQAIIDDKGATEGEKAAAQAAINRISSK